MLQQVSEKLLAEFVQSLEARLATGQESAQAPNPEPVLAVEAPPIDLLDLAGGSALKKYGPRVFGAFALAALIFTLGRLRIARKALRR
jgi:hypothetical protein